MYHAGKILFLHYKTMSLVGDGTIIECDGAGCDRTAQAPIGLGSFLSNSSGRRQTTIGWLYVCGQDVTRHFCPQCAGEFIRSRTDLHTPYQASLLSGRSVGVSAVG
jgi:hypothetical protein